MKNKTLTRELWIGFLGILSLLIIYLLINFFKGVNLIDEGNNYYVKFDNIGEIVNSSPVFINGYKVGNVQNINYDFKSQDGAYVLITVDNRLQIPEGSIAEIETELLGSSTINIKLAKGNRIIAAGDTLNGRLNSGAMGEAAKMIPTLNNMLPKVDSILLSLNTILANPAINNTLNNVEQLTTQLNSTSAELNKMLKGDIATAGEKLVALEDEMLKLSEKLNEIEYQKIVASLEASLSNIEQLTAALNNGEGTAGMLLKDSTLYTKLNNTCEAATALLEDLKENPKRYVHFSVFGRK